MKKCFSILILFVFLMGCQSQRDVQQENITLKVLAFNKQNFNEIYGNFFLATHPNYSLEVISIMESLTPGTNITDTIEELLLKETPDVISISMDSYSVLSENGKLASLQDWVKKDKFDLTGYSPAIIDYLKDEQGSLHGLAPAFIGQALYYNKKLFDQYGISYPADYITWDEVFVLAQRFPIESEHETPQFGLFYKNHYTPFMTALTIGEGSGLSLYSNDKFTLSSQSWENVFKNVTSCFAAQVCYDPNRDNKQTSKKMEDMIKESYPFLAGNIAMAVDDSTLYRTLTRENHPSTDFDWGLATFPVSAENPNMGNGVVINDIFSIPVHAEETKGAWEFIKYVSGTDYAKLMPQINAYDLPSRPAANTQDERLEAFYKLERINNKLINQLRELPRPLITTLDEISPKYIDDIMSERLTVAEGLKQMETELQAVLDQAEPALK